MFAVPHCLIRAAEVAKELLGDGFSGVVITDRPVVDNCFHLRQLCWAHLLRDFQERIDAGAKWSELERNCWPSAKGVPALASGP